MKTYPLTQLLVSREQIDSIIERVVSTEQRAIFLLNTQGVNWSRMRLYRKLVPYWNQGVMVDGKIAAQIRLVLDRGPPPLIMVELTFMPPYHDLIMSL